MSKLVTILIALAILAPVAAHADAAAGTTCSNGLTPDGKQIYAASMAAKPTAQTMREVVEKETRGLAMGGKIARGEARENAVAAGECIRMALE